MKWHKFESNFWETETAYLLEKKFGLAGPVVYLRIVATIMKEINTAEDLRIAHEIGWKKSMRDWALAAKKRVDIVRTILTYLHDVGKLSAALLSEDMMILKIKNLDEFVHKDALSSSQRRFGNSAKTPSGGPSGGPDGGQDKIRQEKRRKDEKIKDSIHVESPQKPVTLFKAEAVKIPELDSLWNSNSGTLPKVLKSTEKRHKLWIQRWRENPNESYWKQVIQKIAESPFCQGQGDRGWRANIDFLLRPDTHVKVMEGIYDQRGTSKMRDNLQAFANLVGGNVNE